MSERPYHRLLGYYVMLAGAVYICALIMTAAVVFKNMETNSAAKREQLVHATQLFREHVERIFGNVDWIIETARNAYIANPIDTARLEKTLVALGQREEFAFFVTLADTNGFSVASSLRHEQHRPSRPRACQRAHGAGCARHLHQPAARRRCGQAFPASTSAGRYSTRMACGGASSSSRSIPRA